MATKLSDVKYFCDGKGDYAYSSVIGWESSRTRVVRFNFTTGASGATSITIKTQKGTISLQDGKSMSKLPFYVTTSDSSHANALASGGYAVTGYLTKSDGVWSGTASVLLKENTKYYVWFFPYDKTYGWSYWHNNDSYYTTYELSGTSKFTLSVSAGTGSTVTVNRTTSALGTSLAATGNLSNGASIYKGDITMRDTWMSNVNRRLEEAETAREENRQCIRSLAEKLDKNNEDTLSLLIDSKRNTIINFADLVIDENKPVTREQFHRIFKLYKEYEDIIKKNNMTNGEVDIAIRIIKESYEKHMRHHSFVEDIRGYCD